MSTAAKKPPPSRGGPCATSKKTRRSGANPQQVRKGKSVIAATQKMHLTVNEPKKGRRNGAVLKAVCPIAPRPPSARSTRWYRTARVVRAGSCITALASDEQTPIRYSEHPAYPGILTSRCEPLRATLSPAACTQNKQAEKCLACRMSRLPPSGNTACRRTAVKRQPSMSTGKHLPACADGAPPVRCGVASLRLVRKELCVPCYSRRRELKRGRNWSG
ncbi:hypothetical protein SAMN02787142_7729 [Burkholderia sp. WP9]|nr:hypothetical protein SAMN02787142_7729 [Burkholderia sp. WP9]